MRHSAILCCLLAAAVFGSAVATAGSTIADRPEELAFPDMSFDVPDPDGMRFTLSDGTPVFAVEDRALPLIDIRIFFKGGEYLEPAGKEGLVALTSDVWLSGGAGERDARTLDEELDFLAANLHTHLGDVSGSVSLNVLSKDIKTVLPILMDVLTAPRFQEDRFSKAKDDLLQAMKTRNDDIADIERRAWDRLIFGEDYWKNRIPTTTSLDNISADDCREFITQLIRSGNIAVAVAGDFETREMTALLEKSIATLPGMEQKLPAIPQPTAKPEPGVYVINKEDVNQGAVSIGHLGYREGHPNQFPLMVVNDILGGGGFTARMMKKIRSDEGLTYGAYSRLRFPITMPGVFTASFQSKSSTCAYAAELAFGLIRGIREAKVEDDEVTVSKASFIDTFPRRFESAAATAGLFASGELLGRDGDYWTTYRDNVEAVTRADMLKAAKANIRPDDMVVLIVGNLEEIMKGHPDHEAEITDFGTIHRLPLLDPLTLEPIAE